ncbi:MAG: hypothetical protein ACC652_07930, partial [Acidimicrobiales bacterium]
MNDGISPISILLVRGHSNDHRFTDDRLRLRRLSNTVHAVDGSADAIEFLAQQLTEGTAPGFIMLDMNDADNETLVATIRNNDA